MKRNSSFSFAAPIESKRWPPIKGIYDKIRTVSSAYTRKQMMETLEKLVSREILAEKNMLYSFPVHLLRKWLAAKYPLRKVRKEISDAA